MYAVLLPIHPENCCYEHIFTQSQNEEFKSKFKVSEKSTAEIDFDFHLVYWNDTQFLNVSQNPFRH